MTKVVNGKTYKYICCKRVFNKRLGMYVYPKKAFCFWVEVKTK